MDSPSSNNLITETRYLFPYYYAKNSGKRESGRRAEPCLLGTLLKGLEKDSEIAGEVRGKGLMWGVELVKDKEMLY
jgi:adenosylmethionine-8-amino-7-oxononanoate aminotransferase